jgi:hypothetical protein
MVAKLRHRCDTFGHFLAAFSRIPTTDGKPTPSPESNDKGKNRLLGGLGDNRRLAAG